MELSDAKYFFILTIIGLAVVVGLFAITMDILRLILDFLKLIYKIFKPKKNKMKNEKSWIIETDDFNTIKRLVNQGKLKSLDLVFSWSQFDWIFKGEMTI